MAFMLICNKLIPQGRGLAKVLIQRAASVALDWDQRSKSRLDATDSTGRVLGIFLPRGTVMRGGDLLVAEDGSFVRVEAAAQPVLVVRHCSEHGSPHDLMRAAYHLGNRHVQLEVAPDHLKLEPDHVLAQMLRQQHLIVSSTEAAFEPEAGAYASGHGHGHAHQGDHGHHDDHAHHDHGDGGHAHHGHAHHDHEPHEHAHSEHAHDGHAHGEHADHDHGHHHGHHHGHRHGRP